MEWNEIVEAGKSAKAAGESSAWALGDLAATVESGSYGAKALPRFAREIEVNYTTLKRYRDVSRAYESAARAAHLSHRHHQVVAARDDRLELLAKASEENWSAARLQREVSPPVAKVAKPPAPGLRSIEDIVQVLNWYVKNEPDTLRQYVKQLEDIMWLPLLFGYDGNISWEDGSFTLVKNI